MTGMRRFSNTLGTATMLFLAANAWAGGPFDGTWTGTATKGSGSGCHPGRAEVTIADGKVTGTMERRSGPAGIHGTVSADGTLDGRIGNASFAGKFSGDSFEGTYHSTDCGDRQVSLDRGG